MRFEITVSFATLAIVLATSHQVDDHVGHNHGDGREHLASSPKTRRELSGEDNFYLTRRAPPAGDSKGSAGAAPADSCKKLQDMVKKGAPSGGSPKPKTGSGTPSPQTKPPKTGSSATPDASASSTPAATPDATPATAPTRRDLSARQSKPPAGGAPSGPDTKLQGDPKICAAIIKMIEGNKSGGAGGGAPPASSPKTRRDLPEAASHYLTRRAPPAGDSKGSTHPAGGGHSDPNVKLQGDPKLCAAIIKMVEGNKSGGPGGGSDGAPPGSDIAPPPPSPGPKTRRDLPDADSHYLSRRAPPAGDSKGSTGAAPADSCKKLQDMAKKGASSGGSPKPKTGSTTSSPQTKPPKTGSAAAPDASASSTPAATPDAAPATAPARRDLNHNAEHNSLSTRDNKPAGGAAGAAPEGKFQGDPKACAAILKMIEALKAGGAGASASGPPAASPKTRRELSGADNDRMIRRAAPAGDSKPSAGAAPADSCKKLHEMAKKAMQGAGSKPKSGSASPPAASPDAKPKGGAAATPDASAAPAASPDASSAA